LLVASRTSWSNQLESVPRAAMYAAIAKASIWPNTADVMQPSNATTVIFMATL
jgi:hypothetical protein